MGKLTDILNGCSGGFNDTWNSTPAAADYGPVPRGEYVCTVTKGDLEASRTRRTPGYKVEFTVVEGQFQGRKFWLDLWLTPAALPQSKRDLGKLGITTPEQMEQPLPRGIRCNVQVVARRDDDGVERNHVRSFEVIGIDSPEADPFAPLTPGDEPDSAANTSSDVPF